MKTKETPKTLFKIYKNYKEKNEKLPQYIKTVYSYRFNLEEKNKYNYLRLKYIYGDNYIFKNVDSSNYKNLVKCYCKKHNNKYNKKLNKLLEGQSGCKNCKLEKNAESQRKLHNNFSGINIHDSDIRRKLNYKRLDPEELVNESKLSKKEKSTYAIITFDEKELFLFYKFLIEKEYNNRITIDEKFQYNNIRDKKESIFLCREYGHFKKKLRYMTTGVGNCPKCSFSGKSKLELDLIRDLKPYFNIENSNKKILKGKEIVLFIKNENLCIEVNGIRWHSDIIKETNWAKTHQIKKFLKAENKGYKLINFYENDFNKKNYHKILREILLFNKNFFKINNLNYNYLNIEKLNKENFKELFKNYSLEIFNENDNNFYCIKYNNMIISIFSFNDNYICNNYCSFYNINEDLDLILDKFPNIVFKLKSDSYNKYKFKEYGFLEIEKTSPICYYLKRKRNVKNKKFSLRKMANDDIRIFDCGKSIMVF